MTHLCVRQLTIIGSDKGLSPGRCQAIIWTNAGILLIRHLGTNFIDILIEIRTFLFKKIHLKMSSRKWRPFCLGLNELILINYHLYVIGKRTYVHIAGQSGSLSTPMMGALLWFSNCDIMWSCEKHRHWASINWTGGLTTMGSFLLIRIS